MLGDPGKVESAAPRGALRPAMVDRWREFLSGDASRKVAAFDAWHRVKDIPAEQWPDVAMEKLRLYQTEGSDADLVTVLLEPSPPADLAQFAERLGQYLETAYNGSTHEEARQALSEGRRAAADWVRGINSPTQIEKDEVHRFWAQPERNKHRELEKKVTELQVNSPHAPPRAMVVRDDARPKSPRIFLRGNPGRPGDPVPRRFLEALQPVVGGEPFSATRSGRLELANAITHPDNPLTARVIVNRVWRHHFGQGLVATPSDFGVNGERPSHPELLDYLARWFMDHGWSIKQLHRTIMLSSTYLQASQTNAKAAQIDEGNRLLWRQNRRRLEFEPLRDAMLVASDKLDRTVGGKPVDLEKRPYSTRRSVYGFLDREDLGQMFSTFDFPNPDASVGRRAETSVPQQPLFLMNHPFVVEQARSIASSRQVTVAAETDEQVIAIYRTILSRDPSGEEQTMAIEFLEQEQTAQQQQSNDTQLGQFSPLARLAQVLLISNEFMFVD